MRPKTECALALLLALVLGTVVPLEARANPYEGWNPPPGFTYDNATRDCVPHKVTGHLMMWCYFGPEQNVTNHTGLAYFRICGLLRQKQPFLLVDYKKMTFTFNPGQGGRVEQRKLRKSGYINGDYYFGLLAPAGNPCSSIPDPPATDI
jgi:hypothetical protein